MIVVDAQAVAVELFYRTKIKKVETLQCSGGMITLYSKRLLGIKIYLFVIYPFSVLSVYYEVCIECRKLTRKQKDAVVLLVPSLRQHPPSHIPPKVRVLMGVQQKVQWKNEEAVEETFLVLREPRIHTNNKSDEKN